MITEITTTEVEAELHQRNYYETKASDTNLPSSENVEIVADPSLYQSPFFWLLILLGVASLD